MKIFQRNFVLLSVLLSFVLQPVTVLRATPPEKPNILLIIADDLNDWIGPMGGHPQAKTPNLDKLAARGVTFMNAQCPAPLCNPSRTAFMSGMRPSTTGVYDNQQVWMPHIGPGLCMNDYFRKYGFTSLGSGKIYHYRNYKPAEWDEVVFYGDDTLPMHPATRRPGPFGYRMFTEDEPKEAFNEKRAESELVDARSVAWCVDKLKAQTNRFFMVCGVHRPHTPWDVPKKYFDLYSMDTMKLPQVLTNDLADVPPPGIEFAKPDGVHKEILKQGLWKDRVRAYLAAISFADAQIGHLLDALDQSSFKDNTIVVFVGDNGWHLGEKEHWAKVTLWSEAARVPMIWAVPGLTPKGSKCVQGVDLMSIYPTFCEVASVPTPKHVDGVSIRPLLEKPDTKWERPGLCTMYKDNHTLVTADWRYIHYADGSEELYNTTSDPNEWTNVATRAEFKEIKAKLVKYLPAKNAEPVAHQDAAAGKKKKGKRAGKKKNRTE